MVSAWITLGLVGFGWNGPPLMQLRLGIIAVGFCLGGIPQHLARARQALGEALAALRSGRE
jgi:hypothetical protein